MGLFRERQIIRILQFDVGLRMNLSLVLSFPILKNNHYFGGRKYLTSNSTIGLPCMQAVSAVRLRVPLSGEILQMNAPLS